MREELARRDATLLDLVDSILRRGAVVNGDLTLAVADVDLVQVNLRALLASVDTVRRLTPPRGREARLPRPRETERGDRAALPQPAPVAGTPPARAVSGRRAPIPRGPRVSVHHERRSPATRVNTDPEDVGRGLAQLVLTVVELLHQLMERQALYRMESESLTDEQVERLGQTFLRLEERMEELKQQFGLEQEDLNLQLGPLGDLM
jgi:hypothetical protein